MNISHEILSPKALDLLQKDPVFHIEKVQGVNTLQPYQHRVAEAIAKHSLVAIRAAHDLGKTWLMAKIVLWFGSVFPRSKIITTAPTFTQVEKLLWSEIRAGYSASKFPLGGRMLTTDWKIDDDWFAIGLSPKDDADSSGGGQGKTSGFQGFHAPYILVVFDEATGVPSKRWLQAHGMLTSANVKMVAIGNPTSKNTDFYKCFQSKLWKKVHLSCFDSPNLIANGITNMSFLEKEVQLIREMNDDEAESRIRSYKIIQPALLTLSWVIDRALTWGLTHPLFASKAIGNFPEEDDNALFTLGGVEEAQRRKVVHTAEDRLSIGVDVARFGSDRTVITPIVGKQAFHPKEMVKRSNTHVAGEVLRLYREFIEKGCSPKNAAIVVDGTGVGSGVVDCLKESQENGRISKETDILEVHFGQGFDDVEDETEKEYCKTHYFNLKARMIVRLSEDIKSTLAVPPVSEYETELPTILYKFDSKGRYVIESKDEYRDRTGLGSPDYTDSLALANEGLYRRSKEVGVIRIVRA